MNNNQYIAALKQERDLVIQHRADKIAELAAQVHHLADIDTERQLRIRQLEAMIIKNQAEDLKERVK
jgi:hypothetical protein